MTTVLLTGGTGYLGRHLLPVLAARGHAVQVLVRPGARPPAEGTPLSGTLEALPAIPAGSVVVHLAAQTGRASPASFERVNVGGTRALLDAARAAGAARMLFISSIAATYTDRRWYPYAASKRDGEALVRASGLPFDIVRPTIVLGPDSPALVGLRRLAAGPVGLRFGSADVPVQPIHVEDAATALADLLDASPANHARDLGGAEVLTLRELLERIRAVTRGARRPFLTLPLAPVRALLAAVEAAAGPVLPLTAGQLALFANDGRARELPAGWAPVRRYDLDAMLSGAA